MTQEEKEILLIDLCGRIPYNTRLKAIDSPDIDFYLYCMSSTDIVAKTAKGGAICMSIEGFKPYLFPMSSMTDEQKKHLKIICDWNEEDVQSILVLYHEQFVMKSDVIDWFNKNHFDYRGLISKELAIDCTNLNIY